MQIAQCYVVTEPLFELGETVITIAAGEYLQKHSVDPVTLLARHQAGDWSDMLPECQAENREELKRGNRILSSYKI